MGSQRKYENSVSTILEIGGQFGCAQGDSVVVKDAGAKANLVCFRWRDNYRSHLLHMGSP